jgi:predicted amidohydrolase
MATNPTAFLKVALIQTAQWGDKAKNIDTAFGLVREAVADFKPDLVILPEMFAFYSADQAAMIENAEPVPGGSLYQRLSALAVELNIHLHAGTILETGPEGRFNTTLVFDPKGAEIARYRKIHCFDITAPDGAVYRESDVFQAGNQVVTYDIGDIRLGCTICYDLRFSELFLALQERGVDAIIVPAAFTAQTGRDHWEILLRARAIETQSYLLAAGQTGPYDHNSRATWGHSLAIDPWGRLLADAGEETGFITAILEKEALTTVRGRIPMRVHRKARGFELE